MRRLRRRGRVEGLREALRYSEPYFDPETEAELDLGVLVRVEAAEALAEFDWNDAAPALADALYDPEPAVRLAAVRSLAGFGTPVAFQPLADCAIEMDDESGDLALELFESWRVEGTADVYGDRLLQRATPPLEERQRDGLARLLAIDPDSRPAIADRALAVLRGSDERSERCAEEVLSELGPSIVNRVLGPLSDGVATPRLIRAAGRLGDARLVEPVIGKLDSDSPAMRCAAADAAGTLNHTLAVPALLSATQDDEQAVRDAASAALNRMGVGAVIAGLAAIVGSELGQRALAVADNGEALEEADTPAGILTRTRDFIEAAASEGEADTAPLPGAEQPEPREAVPAVRFIGRTDEPHRPRSPRPRP